MIQTIILYGSLFLLLEFSATVYSKKDKSDKRELTHPAIYISIAAYAIVFGLRYEVGMDYLSYLRDYLLAPNQWYLEYSRFEIGWATMTSIIGKMNLHYTVYFGFIALLQGIFLYKAFTSYPKIMPYFVLVFILGGFFITFQNGLRQCLVISVEIFLLMRFDKIKWHYYILGSLLLTLIHQSAFILLLIYPLMIFKKGFVFSGRNLAIIYITCVCIGYLMDMFSSLISSEYFSRILTGGKYEEYLESARLNDRVDDAGLGFLLMTIFNVCVFYTYYRVNPRHDSHLNCIFRLFFIGTCLSVLFPTSILIQRPLMYLKLIGIASYSIYFKNLISLSSKKIGYNILSKALLASWALLLIQNAVIKPEGNKAAYHFFWDPPFVGYTYYN